MAHRLEIPKKLRGPGRSCVNGLAATISSRCIAQYVTKTQERLKLGSKCVTVPSYDREHGKKKTVIIELLGCRFFMHQAASSKAARSFVVDSYFPVVGLEIHAQISSKSKLFSRAPYCFGSPPNSQLALLDVAIPGSMPVLNKRCAEAAILVALGLSSRVNLISRFDRKHYFYADSPSGYQITQHEVPVAENGYLDYIWSANGIRMNENFVVPLTYSANDCVGQSYFVSRARIRRIQIEQDTGKSLHDSQRGRSLIDLNRSGVGLVELVTEPDFICAPQAAAFIHELSCLLTFLNVCHANASLGELRVDVNVSVGPSWSDQGPRTEVKNVNSIRGVMNAIEFEVSRQVELLRTNQNVTNETRAYDPVRGITLPMRDKEVIQDYRYCPEPNLPPLRILSNCYQCNDSRHISSAELNSSCLCLGCLTKEYQRLLSRNSPDGKLPNANRQRFALELGLGLQKASVLAENFRLAALFDSTLALLTVPTRIAGLPQHVSETKMRQELGFWICGQLHGMLKRDATLPLPPVEHLVEFIEMNLRGEIHGSSAEKLLKLIANRENNTKSPRELATAHDWILIYDETRIRPACVQVVKDNPGMVTLYSAGKRKKAVKRLVDKLMTHQKYKAEKFNQYVAEKIIQTILDSQTEGAPPDRLEGGTS
ncbi:unnamed protein product [Calicophoron daubneyi]|uniref:Glutamyl-tRNA(Gln) amidotransferase subunit B, mitochondrial n=1 Tax=Calicophoron daubneyi TaxID=300641 RepID=A0AAV2TIK1_CALDB